MPPPNRVIPIKFNRVKQSHTIVAVCVSGKVPGLWEAPGLFFFVMLAMAY
jgi:hypothetical protein